MDRESAKREVKQREPDFLEPAKRKVNGATSYICPSCGNGSGTTGDGIALDPHSRGAKRYKCFVCGISEDVIGLWKLHTGIEDDKEAFDALYRYYQLSIDNPLPDLVEPGVYQKEEVSEQYTNTHTKASEPLVTEEGYMNYCRECMKNVGKTAYFKGRGLSDAVIKKYMLGYDENYNKGTGGKRWCAAIIPTSKNSFVARNTDLCADKKDRYRKNGSSRVYLEKRLAEATEPVFIVEGELDALSIIEIGAEAVGLGSTANYRSLLGYLKNNRPKQPIVLALDNDEDGENTAQAIAVELTGLNIPFRKVNLYGDNKDANEALLADREAFTEAVRGTVNSIMGEKEEELRTLKEEYMKTSTASHLQSFIDGIADSVNTPYIPTGFKAFDEALDGGLYEGLYIIGAISSLGKTTLALQIADQIAEQGEDVLIFSLEMARTELMAKSISRLTLLDAIQNGGDIRLAKSTRGITTGSRYKYYSGTEVEMVQRAIKTYGNYASNIYIHEGIGNIGTEQIREAIEKHILFTGKKPVVLIDYLQILAPADIRATDKQNTDKAVLELKRISRDFKIPVLGISSVNRASYNTPATMEMLKESGSLEYGSDCVLGLQLNGVGKKDFDVNQAKNKNPREVELVVLKNRNGATGKTLSFKYYPVYNYFEEEK